MATQLEMELWDQLHQAQQMPEAIVLVQMLDAVEAANRNCLKPSSCDLLEKRCFRLLNCVLCDLMC